jgi:hypothetical protein
MTLAIAIGVVLGLVIAGTCTLVGMDRDRALYPAAMIVIAAYYVLFALMGGSTQALLIELAVGLVFVALALASFKTSLWLVAGAIAGHGVFDVVHPHVYVNAGVPWFWPAFCGSIDVVLGAYLAWRLASKKVSAR